MHAVSAALRRLQQDTNLSGRTNLLPNEITSLLTFCLNSTEFCYNGNYYRQIHGTAMGSPVSVVVANLVMEEIECRALATFNASPRIYKRYVDDSICVINREKIHEFHQHLNQQDVNIKFTIERYADPGLPFLDTLNKVCDDGTIQVSLYRKKTHTDKYLDFNSHHQKVHKAAVVRTLAHRSETLLVDSDLKSRENDHIKKTLSENGYPKKFVQRHLERKSTEKENKEAKEKCKGLAVLPYIQNVTERISRILSSYNIKTCMKPNQTLREILSKPKDQVEKLQQTGVVYSIPCQQCDVKYIGETKRALGTREKEHQAALRRNHAKQSALAEHAIQTGHDIDWEHSTIIYKEERWHQRKWLEAWQIAKHGSNALFNRDSGRTLPDSYRSLFNICN